MNQVLSSELGYEKHTGVVSEGRREGLVRDAGELHYGKCRIQCFGVP